MRLTRSDPAKAVACALFCLTALLLAWPFANLSFNDDWTWALTVLQLSKTGHLLYNGWSSPPVIAQAYWGLIWVKAFGFSFNILRVSSLPMASGAVVLSYLLSRRAGLTPALSIFISLMLGLSPLFMPLASTFMTDVPGVCFMLLSLYALVRGFEHSSRASAHASTRTSAMGWLLVGVMAALIGGSSRQLVWIVPLIVLPFFSWIRRSDFLYVASAIVGWLAVFGGAIAMQHWFGKQPYAMPDPRAISYLHAFMHGPKRVMIGVVSLILTLVMAMLPLVVTISLPWLRPRTLAAILLAGAIWLILRHVGHPLEPWMGNIFTSSGVLSSIEVGGGRPEVFGHRSRLVLSVMTIFSLSLLLIGASDWIWKNRQNALKQTFNFFLNPRNDHTTVAAMVLLTLALLALEMTRAISAVAYDRHLLPFIPFLGVPLLAVFQHRSISGKSILVGWVLISVFGVYAVASTQEVNSLARARVIAIRRLEDAGVAATQIDGGFEHDYWTQAFIDGHINDARLRNPPGAYRSDQGPLPAMHILYRLESAPSEVSAPTAFGSVQYFSLLPPFHRTVYIDRFTDPWWLNPARAATRPAEVTKQLLPKVLFDQYKDR